LATEFPGAAARPDPPHDVHVDPAGQLAFLDDHYLSAGRGFIAEGGGKVKVVVGATGSGKTHFLNAVLGHARARGFLTVEVDAALQPLAGFDQLYRAVAAGLDLAEMARRFIAATLRRSGYGDVALQPGETLASWCEAHGHEPGPLRIRLEEQLHRDLERNSDLDVGYAVGLARWCAALAWGTTAEDPLAEGLGERWLRGERLPVRDCNRLRLGRALDRFNARLWLRSLLQFVRQAGWPGLVVGADNLGALLQKSRPGEPPVAWEARLPASVPYYTAQKAADFYEMVRTLIDETGLLPGFLLLLAGPPELMTDERRGIPSYVALAERLRTEIETVELNRFADVIVPERLWAADSQAGRILAERLADNVAPGAAPEVRARAVAAALAQWQVRDVAVSAVRRSVLAALDAAGGDAQ
jgi:hypothetical protein